MENKKASVRRAVIAVGLLIVVGAIVYTLSSGRLWDFITCKGGTVTSSGDAFVSDSSAVSGSDSSADAETQEIVSLISRDHEDVMSPNYKSDYYIVVYTLNCSTMVLEKDENGRYTKQTIAFLCSPGADETPTQPGVYDITEKLEWRYMMHVYGHYCTRIGAHTGYLFHSVPYYEEGELDNQASRNYDKLGTRASHGCVRLCSRDAKWIYDNIPIGTQVHVIDDKNGPEGRPVPQRSLDSIYNFWDPTDDNKRNPYVKNPPEDVTYFTHTSYGTTASTAYSGE